VPVDLIREQDEVKAHTHNIVLWKRKWQEYENSIPFEWTTIPLEASYRRKIPNTSGIYTLIVKPNIAQHPACSYLMYLGKTISLQRRFGEYLNEQKRVDGRPKIYRLLNKYVDHVFFCFTLVSDESLDVIEEALLTAFIPPANDRFPAEVSKVVGAF
jgi:hypothetical protein